jgi:hypothetical protein
VFVGPNLRRGTEEGPDEEGLLGKDEENRDFFSKGGGLLSLVRQLCEEVSSKPQLRRSQRMIMSPS